MPIIALGQQVLSLFNHCFWKKPVDTSWNASHLGSYLVWVCHECFYFFLPFSDRYHSNNSVQTPKGAGTMLNPPSSNPPQDPDVTGIQWQKTWQFQGVWKPSPRSFNKRLWKVLRSSDKGSYVAFPSSFWPSQSVPLIKANKQTRSPALFFRPTHGCDWASRIN